MNDVGTIFVVDDDLDMRVSMQRLLEALEMPVELFASAEEFLRSGHATSPGCLLLDVRMPGMGGLQLLEILKSYSPHPPVILITAHGDIPMVVRALKTGALDFIEKPANPQSVIDAVQQACAQDRANRTDSAKQQSFQGALATLSPRERQVMEYMVAGTPNKVIASELGISERTLEKHRRRLMEKMGARSLAELIRAIVTSRLTDDE